MRKHMKRLILLTALLLGFYGTAQQAPHFTQFMYNMNIVNPAYAGIKNGLAGGLLYRTQWVGGDGHPVSYTFNIHSRLGEKTGLGLAAIHDQYGLVTQTDVALHYSYTIEVSPSMNLAFGLDAGVGKDNLDFANLVYVHSGDPYLRETPSAISITYGAGLFLYSEKFYISLSAPNINKRPYESNNTNWTQGRTIHYFGAAGYVLDVSKNLKIKPHLMVYKANGTPISTMLNTNFFLYDKLELGVSYRIKDAVSGLINFLITDNIRVGYAYDRTLSEMKLYSPNTHEVFLNFVIPYKRKAFMSPIYF